MAPLCVAGPDAGVPLEAALVAMGLPSFTLLPLVDAKPLGAIVLVHPEGGAPCESVRSSADVLESLGRRIGSSMRLQQMGVLPTVSNAMQSIALVGRMASLGTIAGGLIHEINNPATFIALAGCQIEKLVAKDRTAEEPTVAKVLDLSEGIRDSTQQVRDMVAAFRLLVGAANRSVVVTVDLERVLAAAVALTRAAHRHDAVIETEFDPMPPCPGHYVELGSVVVNVLVNAIESLRSSSSPKSVRVEGCVRDDVIEVRIRDTGEGMTEEVLSRAFDPFFTTRDRSQHAGLGLTVARETLVAFDGTIRIESERGKGTTVSIDVPFRQTASIPPPPP
jgi:signal transduction histidine kinase